MGKVPKHYTIADLIIGANQTVRRDIRNTSKYWFDITSPLANKVIQGFQISAIKAKKIKRINEAINGVHTVTFNEFQNELSKNLVKSGLYKDYNTKTVYTFQAIELANIYRLFYKAFTKKRIAIVWRDMEKNVDFNEDTALEDLVKVKHLSLTIYLSEQNFNTELVTSTVLQGKNEDNAIGFNLSELIANYNSEMA